MGVVWWCRVVGLWWCRAVTVLLLFWWYCVAALMVFRGCVQVLAHGVQWGKKRNKSAHNSKKCAISYVMLLNFLAYMYFCGARACIFLKRPYLCIVFFIVLDLRLTRLGYSGIPFFLSLRQDALLREAWKTHVPPRKIICSERFFALPLLVGGIACIFLLFSSLFFFSFSRRETRRPH